MNTQEKYLSRFLHQEQASKKITRYVLRCAAKGKSGHPIEEFVILEALSGEDFDRLAENIYSRAQMDANGLGPSPSPYRYTLTSYEQKTPDGSDTETGRQAFRVRAEADLDLDGDEENGEEAATNKGLMTQLMRHNEANNRTLIAALANVMSSMGRREEQQSKTIDDLLDERMEMFRVIEASRSEQMQRELTIEAEKRKQARFDQGVGIAKQLAPTIVSYLTDGKVGSQAPTAKDVMVKELFGSLDQEQFMTIIGALNPTQRATAMRLIELLQAKKESDGSNGSQSSDDDSQVH